MGEDPNRIRHEIEAMRAEYESERSSAEVLSEPVREMRTDVSETSALGHKANLKSRVTESVSKKKDSLVGGVSSGKDAVVGRADALVSSVTGVVPDKGQVVEGARKVGVSKENPLGPRDRRGRRRLSRRPPRALYARRGRKDRRNSRSDEGRSQRERTGGARPGQASRPGSNRRSDRNRKGQRRGAGRRDDGLSEGQRTGDSVDWRWLAVVEPQTASGSCT